MTELDPRIAAGMQELLAVRDTRVRAGDRQIGWKVGFGSPSAAEQLRINRPLVGFLLEGGVLPDGAEVSLAGWTAPTLEPEIAVHMAGDVPSGAARGAVQEAIRGLSAAIELVDLDPPPTDVRAILAGNIYHRRLVLGRVDEARRTGEGIGARVLRAGEEIAATDDPSALTGELVEVVRLTAELLEACGERVRAGEVVITGSVAPPQPVTPGRRVEVELGPLGGLTVHLR